MPFFWFPDDMGYTGVTLFHDTLMSLMLIIVVLVFYVMTWILANKMTSRIFESLTLEMWWTMLPILMLLIMLYRSIRLLYNLEDKGEAAMTVKAIGHQWYWSYELGSGEGSFDSYMLPLSDLSLGQYRLLEVDNRLLLPKGKTIQMIVTSADVIHSWTVPALSIKMDGVPGRLNQIPLLSLCPAVMYGQCSEICGANHSFMPIVVETV